MKCLSTKPWYNMLISQVYLGSSIYAYSLGLPRVFYMLISQIYLLQDLLYAHSLGLLRVAYICLFPRFTQGLLLCLFPTRRFTRMFMLISWVYLGSSIMRIPQIYLGSSICSFHRCTTSTTVGCLCLHSRFTQGLLYAHSLGAPTVVSSTCFGILQVYLGSSKTKTPKVSVLPVLSVPPVRLKQTLLLYYEYHSLYGIFRNVRSKHLFSRGYTSYTLDAPGYDQHDKVQQPGVP